MNKQLQITMKVTRQFFDADAVRKHMARKKRRALSRQGAFVRRGARSLLRKRKRASAPGQPPSVRSGNPNIRTIYFAYEASTGGVVVGPIRLRTKTNVAALHEHGGTAIIRENGRQRTARYPARPYMSRALSEAIASPKFMGPWKE